jgi:serine/threonine-protein kinase RsbW
MDEQGADVPVARPPLPAWAATLPAPAAKIIYDADLSKPNLYLPMPAAPVRLRTLRAEMSDWAAASGATDDQREDIILAVNEAAANSIEHAYRGRAGLLTVFAGYGSGTGLTHVIVSDYGEWRVPPADPGFRGRGLAIIKEIAPVFELHHDQYGTTVVLGWHQLS